MPAKKTQNKNLVNLLEDYWREIVKGIPKTEGSGAAANLKDADSLVSKWKNFGQTLNNFALEITNVSKSKSLNPFQAFFGTKAVSSISVVQMKLTPKAVKDRAKLNISLSVNLDMDGTLENIRTFTEKYREYKEGAGKIVEQKKIEMEKQKKLAEMASKSIETIVPQIMSQSGYEWNLESEYKYFGTGGTPERYILRIKTKKHKMIEITLNKNNFAEKIPEILNVVKQIEQLLEQVPYAVNIVNSGPGTRWIKGTENVKESP